MNQSLPTWITDHCQFGNHGEPFLWSGSGNDGVDIAIMQLINLAKDNPKLAHEAAEFVDACVKDAAQQKMHPTNGGLRVTDSLSNPATIGG